MTDSSTGAGPAILADDDSSQIAVAQGRRAHAESFSTQFKQSGMLHVTIGGNQEWHVGLAPWQG